MSKKMAMFVFNGDPMCVIHVFLNALDMSEQGYDGKIIMEGAATKLIAELVKPDHPLHPLWEKVKTANLVEGVCRACAKKMGTIESAKQQGLTLLDEMSGHPSMTRYRKEGFEIVSF